MGDYTPTADEVRSMFCVAISTATKPVPAREAYAGFDRWLADRDRWVAAGALVDAAADIRARGDVGEEGGPTIDRYLTIRAKNIVQS